MMTSFTERLGRPHMPLLGAALLLGISGCAPMDAPETDADDALLAQLDTSQACFTQREIRGYSRALDGSGGRERIFLDTGANERFLLETVGACPDLDFSLRIALGQRTIGSVCTGDLETLVIPSAIPQEFADCPVRVLGRVPKD